MSDITLCLEEGDMVIFLNTGNTIFKVTHVKDDQIKAVDYMGLEQTWTNSRLCIPASRASIENRIRYLQKEIDFLKKNSENVE
jgi:hypothetical protein